MKTWPGKASRYLETEKMKDYMWQKVACRLLEDRLWFHISLEAFLLYTPCAPFPCSSTVEHLAVNEGVTGSNPVGGANNIHEL